MPITVEQEIGPYRIVSQLGRGGMATVFKAYQPTLERYVALKVLRSDFQGNPDFLSRFELEAKIIAKLDHPNIVPIYDIGEFEDTPYLVMRFIEGQTLREYLNKRKQAVRLSTVMAIMRPATSALAYAHQKGILHRDVKPSNIMLGNDGNVYLMDFGLARIAAETDMTMSKGLIIGTPYYISPEQAKGESVDNRTDIYSLGVVLYELLTGKVPFTGETPNVVVYHQIFTLPARPSKINPQVLPALDQVALKALAKDKTERFSSVPAMMQALQEAIQAQTKASKPAETAESLQSAPTAPEEQTPLALRTAQPARRKQSASTWLLGLAIIVLLGELVFFFPFLRSELRQVIAPQDAAPSQGGPSDLMRIIIGTFAAYIATLSTHVILNSLRQRLPKMTFFFAVAFGITLVIAMGLGLLVLVLLNVM